MTGNHHLFVGRDDENLHAAGGLGNLHFLAAGAGIVEVEINVNAQIFKATENLFAHAAVVFANAGGEYYRVDSAKGGSVCADVLLYFVAEGVKRKLSALVAVVGRLKTPA